jgi:hypothetical protein
MAGAIVFTASFVPIASHAKTHQTAENNSTTLYIVRVLTRLTMVLIKIKPCFQRRLGLLSARGLTVRFNNEVC